jgi:hypothetical protein
MATLTRTCCPTPRASAVLVMPSLLDQRMRYMQEPGMKKHLLTALALGLGLTLTPLWFLRGQVRVVQSDPGVRFVALNGDDAGLCDSIANRCRAVQRALEVADSSDEIRVAVGV